MKNYTTNDMQEALRPITSLISKSEKAQSKLVPKSWQHAMLRDNLKALRIALALMSKKSNRSKHFTRDNVQEAHRALDSMISKTEKTRRQFLPGTSQHSLQRNRLKALRIAKALINTELDRG